MNTLIQAYGLFWKAESVHWGRGKKAGALLGVRSGGRRGSPIDFRDQVGIYILYDGHRMVYVGQAGRNKPRLLIRLRHHRRDNLAGRWDTFSWFGLRRVLNNGDLSHVNIKASASLPIVLDQMEAILVAGAEPSLNRQGGRFGKGAHRYYQVRDDRLPPTQSEMIQQLWKGLRKRGTP